MHEVHVYLAEGDVLSRDNAIRPIGERHPLMIFWRQEINTEHDLDLCTKEAYKIGWGNIEIKKAGTINNSKTLNSKGAEYLEAYKEAMSSGSYLLVVGGIFEKDS